MITVNTYPSKIISMPACATVHGDPIKCTRLHELHDFDDIATYAIGNLLLKYCELSPLSQQ